MALAAGLPDMARDSVIFVVVTLVIVVGSLIMLAGVGAFEHMRLDVIGVGSAIMVAGILGLAGLIHALPEPEGHDAESGH